MQLGNLKGNCLLLKLYRKLRKIFLGPGQESNPQPFDLRWDSLTGDQKFAGSIPVYIYIYTDCTKLHWWSVEQRNTCLYIVLYLYKPELLHINIYSRQICFVCQTELTPLCLPYETNLSNKCLYEVTQACLFCYSALLRYWALYPYDFKLNIHHICIYIYIFEL